MSETIRAGCLDVPDHHPGERNDFGGSDSAPDRVFGCRDDKGTEFIWRAGVTGEARCVIYDRDRCRGRVLSLLRRGERNVRWDSATACCVGIYQVVRRVTRGNVVLFCRTIGATDE
jgi:hypothetical protein